MQEPLIRVMALHALAYCERLFYLEEVEEIRVADERVYAGRTLHESEVPQDGEFTSQVMESETWGIKGKVDYIRHRDGMLIPFEHKRGHSCAEEAWPSDRLQIIAYASLLQEHSGKQITEGRIRYHANNKTVRITINEEARSEFQSAIARARQLSSSIERPPVTEKENLCAKCSLAPVCLPEEERLARGVSDGEETTAVPRLFPEDDERLILHVTEAGSRVSKSGEQIVVTPREGEPSKFPGRNVSAIVLHGSTQITSQAIHYAASHDVAVHWLTGGGNYVTGISPPGGVQRRHRQFKALSDPEFCLALAKQLARTKVENQLKFILRSARAEIGQSENLSHAVNGLRSELRSIDQSPDPDTLRGREGMAGRHYFSGLPELLKGSKDVIRFSGRTRRPPEDTFNAALSFGYSLLYRDVMTALIGVGLDPAFGFYHRPRSAAYPLALDIMELFRTMLWDMPLVASINRNQWEKENFSITGKQVWLSTSGRQLAINLYEQRKQEKWRHPILKYSLSYARAIELEVRLLEKEWNGAPDLFGQMKLRG